MGLVQNGGLIEVRAIPPTADPGVYQLRVSLSRGGEVVARGTTLIVDDAALAPDAVNGPAVIELPTGDTGTAFRLGAVVSEDATDTAERYRATIFWGDGKVTEGTVHGSGGKFWISGSHAYGATGSYQAVALLRDQRYAGQDWAVGATVRVAALGQGAGYDPGVVGVVRVEPADQHDDARAWVAWNGAGDRSGLATLTKAAGQAQAVLGDAGYTGPAFYYDVAAPATPHEPETGDAPGYWTPGTYTPQVEAVKGESAAKNTWSVVATDAPLLLAGGSPAVLGQFGVGATTGALSVLDFLDPFPSEAGYEVRIDWGDGVRESAGAGVSLVPNSADGRFRVSTAGHTYAAVGEYWVSVLVTSLEGGTAGGVNRNATLVSKARVLVEPTGFRAYQRRDERDDAT